MHVSGSLYRVALVAEAGKLLMRASATSLRIEAGLYGTSPVIKIGLVSDSIVFVPTVAHLSAYLDDRSMDDLPGTWPIQNALQLSPGMKVMFALLLDGNRRVESEEVGYLTCIDYGASIISLTLVCDLIYSEVAPPGQRHTP